jgi:hypothetical protein
MRPRFPPPAGLRALIACAAALELAACTGEKSFLLPGIDAGTPSARYEAVCTGWAERECSAASLCPINLLARWDDSGQCVARETLACELQAADPDVSFDPARVEACSFADVCGSAPGMLSAPDSPTLCLGAGKAPEGAACVWSSGCASGHCVYSYGGDGSKARCGTCQESIRCACAENQECVASDGGSKCVTRPDAGEPCGPPLFSCNDSQCLYAGDGGDGLCSAIPEAALGMPCSAGPGGPWCLLGTDDPYCDATGHCRAHDAAQYGSPCTASTGGEDSVCVGAGWCDSMTTGVCQPPALDGEPCEPGILPCLPPARCLSGACVFPSQSSCAPSL